LSSREDEAGGGIEHRDRALHQLLEQIGLGTKRVQRDADVVQRL
jgi:hypothetical protein